MVELVRKGRLADRRHWVLLVFLRQQHRHSAMNWMDATRPSTWPASAPRVLGAAPNNVA